MRHGSLFSGIGGFDLAAEWMGWENIFHCEWNEFGQKVLKYYWPKAITYNDITKTDFSIHRGTIDILTGGFPCQPYSSAGKRLGKEDERHLWPEMLRAIREIQPRWVVGENVRGLTNWNGGLVFDEVQTELEAQGYEVLPFLLPACAVNAPHRRDRIWFVAYSNSSRLQKARAEQQTTRLKQHRELDWNATNSNSNGLNKCNCNNEINTGEGRINAFSDINESNGNGDVADTNSWGLERSTEVGWHSEYVIRKDGITSQTRNATNTENIRREDALENGELERGRFRQSHQRNAWDSFPSVSPICNGDDGLSDRLDGITFSKWRNESIKAGGNAIVPQVALQIFKAIEAYELQTH
jgi:DNA (cytosine-5)-methyltransferase 1